MSDPSWPGSQPESAFDEGHGFDPPTIRRKNERFEFSRAYSDAWTATATHVGMVLMSSALMFLYLLLTGIVGLILGLPFKDGLFEAGSFDTAIQAVVLILLSPPLIWGLTRFYLSLLDDQADFGLLAQGFLQPIRSYARLLPLAMLFSFAVVVVSIPENLLFQAGAHELGFLVSALSLIFVIVVLGRFHWAYAYAVEQDLGTMAALRASWRLPQGQVIEALLICLIAMCLYIGGILLCVLPSLLTIPLAGLSFLSVYRQKEGRPLPPRSPAPVADAW